MLYNTITIRAILRYTILYYTNYHYYTNYGSAATTDCSHDRRDDCRYDYAYVNIGVAQPRAHGVTTRWLYYVIRHITYYNRIIMTMVIMNIMMMIIMIIIIRLRPKTSAHSRLYIYIYIYTHVYTCILYVYTYVSLYICIHIYICLHVYVSLSTYIYIYTHMYTYTSMYIYIYIYKTTPRIASDEPAILVAPSRLRPIRIVTQESVQRIEIQ